MTTPVFPPVSRRARVLALAVLACAAALAPARAKSLGWNADALAVGLAKAGKLPPPPAGVTDIEFSEFFQTPIGPRGLDFTAKARGLAGQRVRLLGFMVRQGEPSPGVLMLAPYAMTTAEGEYGLCDDLPPATVFVAVAKFADLAVPFTPGPLLLTGRLELGPHEEADGRISQIRLVLDPEPTAKATTTATTDVAPAPAAPASAKLAAVAKSLAAATPAQPAAVAR